MSLEAQLERVAAFLVQLPLLLEYPTAAHLVRFKVGLTATSIEYNIKLKGINNHHHL
jgi:hypothetical protein